MSTDLDQIHKPLDVIIKRQIESSSSETEMYFDTIHLSPLKVDDILFLNSCLSYFINRFCLDSC